MKDLAKEWDEWNPSFTKYNRKAQEIQVIYYEKSWFCNTNKIIHHNKNQLMSCKDCNNGTTE